MGVAATLAWQSYGEAAREMIASAYPQLGWLAPQTAAAETIPETIPQTTPTAAPQSEDLKSILDRLSAVRESVDQLAAQIAANQQKMASDIAELKAAEQGIFDKVSSAPPPRPAAPARKPAAAPQAQPPAR
jgi:ABC-type transporter Mla subunit MlaD